MAVFFYIVNYIGVINMKKLILITLLLSGCFKDSDNWETVKLYQVGTEWLFDCSSGCYRHYNLTTTMIKY